MSTHLDSGLPLLLLSSFAVLLTACSDDGTTGPSTPGPGSPGTVVVIGSSDGGGGATSSANTSKACPSIFEGNYELVARSVSSQCNSITGPKSCRAKQTGCSVSADCTSISSTFTLDANGVSESQSVSMGDGIVASCHVEFTERPNHSMSVLCTAQGITCEWGETKNF